MTTLHKKESIPGGGRYTLPLQHTLLPGIPYSPGYTLAPGCQGYPTLPGRDTGPGTWKEDRDTPSVITIQKFSITKIMYAWN